MAATRRERHPAEDDEDRVVGARGDADVTDDGGVAEVGEVGEATDDDGGDHATENELADRPVDARAQHARRAGNPGHDPDDGRHHRERRGRRVLERWRDHVGPEQVRQEAGGRAGERPGQDADEDRADRVEVDRDLQGRRHGLAEDDVHRDRDRHEDQDARRELAGDRRVGAGLQALDDEPHDDRHEHRHAEDEREHVGHGLEGEGDRIRLAGLGEAAGQGDAGSGDHDERDQCGDPTDDHGWC